MSDTPPLRILLDPAALATAQAGRSLAITRITSALAWRGVGVELRLDTRLERARLARGPGFGLICEGTPASPRVLRLRRVDQGPYWQFETSGDPWRWSVTQAGFEPDGLDDARASAFLARRRGVIFGKRSIRREGFILFALDSGLEQAKEILAAIRTMDREREILVAPGPGATPDPAALKDLRLALRGFDGARMVGRPALELIARCDAVVTGHSTAALSGYFAEKPAVIFGQVEFHHIAGSVPLIGVERAFAVLRAPPPPYARYLWWLLRRQAIDMSDDEAEPAILARLRVLGWEI